MTQTTQTAPAGSWKDLQASLPRDDGTERFPFFPIRDVPSDQDVRLTVIGGPYFQGFHGSYSLVELDVQDNTGKYRLCVSGTRLAAALANVEPVKGDKLLIRAQGAGKERTWTVRKA